MDIQIEYNQKFQKQICFLQRIDEQILDNIKLYTSSNYYQEINRKLCKRKKLNEIEKEIVLSLRSVFSTIPPLEQSITVYRGIRSETVELDRLSCQFISTSFDERIARLEFRGIECCLITITIPAGAKVIPIKDFSEISYELEVLLPENGQWTIVDENIYLYIPEKVLSLTHTSIETKKEEHKEDLIERVLFLFSPEEAELYDNLDLYLLSLMKDLKIRVDLNELKDRI